jgi:hypothetical protein
MTDTIFSLNDAQFQKLLAAQRGWWPVASIFVSAFLAMMAGITVERLRAWFERRKAAREGQQREIQQINAVISGLAFDIELLLHNASQNIIPHYRDTQAVAAEVDRDIENDEHIRKMVRSLRKYPCLFLTFPETYLIEYDFSKELPFIIERDAEIVKHSGWLVNGVRELKDITARRNRCIEGALRIPDGQGGTNLEQFRMVLRSLRSIANTECVVSSQLFDVLMRLVNALEKINDGYKIEGKKSKLTVPKALQETMGELKKISDTIAIHGQKPET